MKFKYVVITVITAFLVGVGSTFLVRPSRVKIERVVEERVVEVVKEVRVRDSERNTHTVITEKPDGTKVTEIVETEKAKESSTTDRNTDTERKETYKEDRRYSRADWIVGGGLTFNVNGDRGAYATVSKRLLLNVYVSGLVMAEQGGFTPRNATVGLGVSFVF